jgi:hypothetical protein
MADAKISDAKLYALTVAGAVLELRVSVHQLPVSTRAFTCTSHLSQLEGYFS